MIYMFLLVFYGIFAAKNSLVHQWRVASDTAYICLVWWIIQRGLLADALPNLDNLTRYIIG